MRGVKLLSLFIGALLATPSMAVTGNWKLAKNQVLRLGNGAEPKELDPAKATGAPEGKILDSIFEGLVTLDPYTMEPVPGVAESWSLSKDGKTYTFKIRKDAKWSDGKPLTANDFVWSWKRALSPKIASEYAYQLYYLKDGESYNKGKATADKVGVSAKDKQTLVVTLESPTPFFLRLCAFRTLYPTPRHVVEKYPDQEWTKEEHIVSNGPFKLVEWKINRHIKVVKNPNYWDAKSIKLNEAYFMPIEQQDTAEKTFFAGGLDLTTTVPSLKIPSYKKEIAKHPGEYHPYKSNPYLGVYYYRFNVTKKPTNDVRVRRALAMTVDRKLIVERVTRGGQIPATSFTPPNTAGYTFKGELPVSVTPEVIKEAKKLLADAGYPNGKGLPPIEILYNTNEDHKKVAIAIQSMWKKNLGIDVKLYNQEWKVYLDSQQKMNYTISRAGWIGDYPDPNTFLDMWLTGGGNNQTGWSNKKYDSLIAEAKLLTSTKERYGKFMEAEKILLDELPVLPIYIYTNNRLVSEKLKMFGKDGKLTEWTPNIEDKLFLKNYALVN
ncbi:MAG: peptide ABC transporter substrate-binding protein [Bdellovibrionota bacterium]